MKVTVQFSQNPSRFTDYKNVNPKYFCFFSDFRHL